MKDPYKIDEHKLIYHPERTAQLLVAGSDWVRARDVYPIYVEISPTGSCNHRCIFCALDYVGYKPDRLDADWLAKRLLEMGRLGVKSVMFGGEGEPLLHKRLTHMIVAADESGIDTALTTNATIMPQEFIDEALPVLSWVKTSINAGTAKSYAAIHQTREQDFHSAVDNMKRMTARKREGGLKCVLGAQSLLLPENAHEMETLARICRDEIGLNYLVIKPYSQHRFSETKIYESIDYSQYTALGETLGALSRDDFHLIFRGWTMRKHSEPQGYDRCSATPFLWAYIMANGSVSGCSAYLLDKRFEFGNIKEQTFQEIWQGERRRENLRFVTEDLDIKTCRINCRMDEINRYLHQIKTASVANINFI